jgi:hypothetical protein
MSRTCRSASAEANFCGRAVHGVSSLSSEDRQQILAHRARDRPTPWAHLSVRFNVNELDLRAMFEPKNDNAQPTSLPIAVSRDEAAAIREARFRDMWETGISRVIIATRLGLDVPSVDRMRQRLGLTKRGRSASRWDSWSQAEDQYIRQTYGARKQTAAQVGAYLGRTAAAVIGRAQRAGLNSAQQSRK